VGGLSGFFLHAWRLAIAGVVVEAPLSAAFLAELNARGLASP
jgi:hypothetical protein